MKTIPTLLAFFAAFATTTSAQIYYDVNGPTAGFGDYNSTTWSTGNANWTTSSAGTATTVTWASAGGASATSIFDTTGGPGGGKTVEVDSDFALPGLQKEGARGLTLQSATGVAQTLTMSGGTIAVNSSNLVIGAGLTLTGDFVKTGINTLTLSVLGTSPNPVANTYAGTMTVNAGTVAFNHGRLSSASNIVLGASGTLTLDSNGDATIGNISGSGLINMTNTNSRSITITQTVDQTFSGTLGDNTTAGSLSYNKAGGATLTLSGANTFDGTMTINDGTIVAASNGALSTTATTVGADGNLQINNGVSLTASGITLAATTSQLTVGTTGATGTATISTLSTTAAGGEFVFDLNGSGAVDLLNITGVANFTGDTLLFSFSDLGGSSFLANTWYTVISAGTLNGPTSVTSVDPSGWSGFNWQVSGNNLQIQYASVIPEPSTWALLAVSLVVLITIRRRGRVS